MDFSNLEYLAVGNKRQQKVKSIIDELKLFEILKANCSMHIEKCFKTL